MRRLPVLAAAAAAAAMLASPAAAVVLASSTTPTGALASPGSISASFQGGAGSATVDFVIQSYLTLDGVNCCTDTFNFSVNNVLLFSAAYNLGGGGTDAVFTPAPAGSTISVVGGANGTITGSIPVTLLNGLNTVTFAYDGAAQGTGDEAWGVNSYAVNGNAFTPGGAVPEPATWAMMIGGTGLAGGSLRARRRTVKPATA